MTTKPAALALLVVACGLAVRAWAAQATQPSYAWLAAYDARESVASRIAPPTGFAREEAAAGSFADWLRHLPLKKGRPAVMLFDGRAKGNQDAHVAVIDIDTGSRDLQQCADAVMRLRGEFLYAKKALPDIHFQFTSGDTASFTKWADGFRPSVDGKRVSWSRTAMADKSYASFRAYLNIVFAYAGSASLSQEMQKLGPKELRAGDVFVEGGYPGHAVIVVDTAREPRSGKRVFLLAQSYMPAQDIQILKNPTDSALSPWYDANIGQTLRTPEWTFRAEHLKRFAE